MGVIDPVDLLWSWLREGWRYRSEQGWTGPARRGSEPYRAQVEREMELIISKDFPSYFLLVSDIVRWAKDQGIAVGPGRGSSAASVVCFLLRITEPDPLDFPLTDFSRFIDPTREDLPDIDIDFDDTRRHEVREYAVAKFGADNVANIGTFTKYRGKNGLDDVARVHSIPKGEIEIVKGLVVERSGGDSRADASLADTFEMFASAAAVLERYPALRYAVALEGNYRGMSVHAAGLVITSRPIAEICAMYTRESKATGQTLTSVSVDKYSAEYLGLMKIDLLGLSTMGMIATALGIIGMTLEELYQLTYDDPETIAAFSRADVLGVFQFEGRATRLVTRDVAPEDFLELVDINALSRPGPFFSGTTSEYIDVKWGRREPTRVHPVIDRITAGTKGQIIYQEQILHALAEFGGLSVARVHEIRRIISQKLGEAQFNTSAEDFAANASARHGVTREKALEVWSRVVTSASYAFVYSHSLAYTIIGYWCMWLKVHHPAAFYAAQLQKMEKEKWPRLIKDAERHGIPVQGVRPGKSGQDWAVRSRHRKAPVVQAGWRQLTGVGETLGAAIETYDASLRQATGRGIEATDQLLNVRGIGPATLEKFRAQLDTDDPFGLLRIERTIRAVRAQITSGALGLRKPTHDAEQVLDAKGGELVVWLGMVRLKEYKDFIEDERARSGKTVEEIKRDMKRPDLSTSCVLHGYDQTDEDVYVRITRFDYREYARGLERLRPDHDVILVLARKSNSGFGASLYAQAITIIDPEED